jgi:hypothetical protein
MPDGFKVGALSLSLVGEGGDHNYRQGCGCLEFHRGGGAINESKNESEGSCGVFNKRQNDMSRSRRLRKKSSPPGLLYPSSLPELELSRHQLAIVWSDA